MFPVSESFLEKINSNTRQYRWTGTITTKNGRTYSFGNDDIVKGSGYITRQCCGTAEIELGTVYAAELGISLFSDIDRYTLLDAQMTLSFHLQLPDGTEEVVPMGVYEVTEANRAIKCLEIKAYDRMLRFDRPFRLDAASGTVYNYLNTICKLCKVELAQTQAEIEALPNGRDTFGVYTDHDIETYRDFLHFLAQVVGCYCQIDRAGKLELKQYGSTPVGTVESRHRFDSSYSDFVTRYTAVSSTNLMTEESEYYALENDDGLTMNLGVNPLLQFGLKTTRERIIRNILKSLTPVQYVPFDGETIGNPALDPGDVVVFNGGHADAAKVSCVTSVTYRINGKHVLKGVGKNPRLAAAKSKNDKDITGLLNQVEAGKIVVYNFTNVTPFQIADSATEIIAIQFTAKEKTTAQFHAQILMDVTAYDVVRTLEGTAVYETDASDNGSEKMSASEEEGTTTQKSVRFTFTERGTPELTVIYKMNDETLTEFQPKQVCVDGRHIIALFLPITQVIANRENTLAVFLKITGGQLSIGETQIRATISGQGLVAGLGDWNGRISVTDSVGRLQYSNEYHVNPFEDSAAIRCPTKPDAVAVQSIGRLFFDGSAFGYLPINERVTTTEVIRTFTMDKNFPPQYDAAVVEINEAGGFCMRSDYKAVSSQTEQIDLGVLEHIAIDTAPFERVASVEVKYVTGS